MRTVRSYDTGVRLVGTPSDELAARSAEVDTGAVAAYRDDAGVWQYVPDAQVDHYRRNLRCDVVTVYVE